MKAVKFIGAAAVALFLVSDGAFADEKKSAVGPKNVVVAGASREATDATIRTDAAIAGAAAAGVTVVGAGVAASTASAAVITSTIAAVGVGSMAVGISVIAAVPILIGAGTYGAYRWFKSKDKD